MPQNITLLARKSHRPPREKVAPIFLGHFFAFDFAGAWRITAPMDAISKTNTLFFDNTELTEESVMPLVSDALGG